MTKPGGKSGIPVGTRWTEGGRAEGPSDERARYILYWTAYCGGSVGSLVGAVCMSHLNHGLADRELHACCTAISGRGRASGGFLHRRPGPWAGRNNTNHRTGLAQQRHGRVPRHPRGHQPAVSGRDPIERSDGRIGLASLHIGTLVMKKGVKINI